MSKIGNRLINLNDKVTLEINGNIIKAKGPKGELSVLILEKKISVVKEENVLRVLRQDDEAYTKAQHGLYNTLITNMIKGVTDGYEKLELIGVGYRAQKKGNGLNISLGFSHPVEIAPISGISFEMEGDNKILVRGVDKQLVGQVAANIRKIRPPEPYKGKGVKYSDERIIRKAGKAAK